MDVSTDNAITIESLKVHKVPLKACGPIGKGLSALLLGRSSATLQGIFVHPGVIDADYMGQICAMVSTPTPPVTIPAKTRIAQLIPFKSCVPKTDSKLPRDGGFRSTGDPQGTYLCIENSNEAEKVSLTFINLDSKNKTPKLLLALI